MSDKLALSDITVIILRIADVVRVSAESGVAEPKFAGSKAPRGRSVHNFRIPIHNLWDEKILKFAGIRAQFVGLRCRLLPLRPARGDCRR